MTKFLKKKNCSSLKDFKKKVKNQGRTERRYLNYLWMMMDLYQEYIKNY